MALGLTDYAVDLILSHLFRNETLTLPTNWYAGLSTSSPGQSGSQAGEPSGNNYARVSVARNTTEWTDPSVGTQNETDNANNITFPQPSGSWGTISHCFLADASSAGNIWFQGALDSSRAIDATSDPPQFNAGAFNYQLDVAP